MIVIYIHVCCINTYKEVFQQLMRCIKESGLYDHVHQIRCCILGEYEESLFADEKIKIWAESPDLSLYEVFTLNTLYDDCKKGECMNVLYLHTKGVTKPGNPYVMSWLEYLCHFNIYKYKECLEWLKTNDAVGVNLNLSGSGRVHFSGNFWWTTSAYVQRLAPCIFSCYNSPEWWLTETEIGNYHCMWDSGVNHYDALYPKHLYAV